MKRRRLVMGLAMALLTACADVNTVKKASREKGKTSVFSVDQERVAQLVLRTLSAEGLDIDSRVVVGADVVIVAVQRLNAFTWGEFIRVIVHRLDQDNTRVTVYWRSRFRDGLLRARDWDAIVFAGIAGHI
jgi:hypothetical protein